MSRHPMIPEPLIVSRIEEETHDTVTLTLDASSIAGGFAFRPGQFNMLYAFGAGEVPISMSGDPARTGQLVHTLRAVGAVTRAICAVEPGGAVGVRGPFGSAWPVDEARGKDVLLVAGGIGLAPLRPVVYRMLAERDSFGRIALLYGARTPKDILFLRELLDWRGRFDLEVLVTVDRADERWRGDVGVVTQLIERVVFDPKMTVAMICGPEIMMRFTLRELERAGVPSKNLYVSMERNMKCAIAQCGHCQYGPHFVCREGPVFVLPRVADLFGVREI